MVLNEFDVFVMKYLSANKIACNVTIMLVYNFFIAVWRHWKIVNMIFKRIVRWRRERVIWAWKNDLTGEKTNQNSSKNEKLKCSKIKISFTSKIQLDSWPIFVKTFVRHTWNKKQKGWIKFLFIFFMFWTKKNRFQNALTKTRVWWHWLT